MSQSFPSFVVSLCGLGWLLRYSETIPSLRCSLGNSHWLGSYCSLSHCSSIGPPPVSRMIDRYSGLVADGLG